MENGWFGFFEEELCEVFKDSVASSFEKQEALMDCKLSNVLLLTGLEAKYIVIRDPQMKKM